MSSRDPSGEVGDVYFSVRTAWDAFLSIQNFPQGSEIILSGINIPHMAELVRLHGLTPVFADLDEQTLLPSLEEVKSKQTNKTVAVLCAHLFGSWSPLDKLAQWCREQGLTLIEDCAQSFMGSDFSGTPQADITLFSFGTIKRSTALGGAVVFVRQPELRRRMLELQCSYEEASFAKYRRKCLRIVLLKVLCWPWVYPHLMNIVRLLGGDPERLLRDSVRGFPASSLPSALRYRPHLRLVSMVSESWNRSFQRDWLARSERIERAVLERTEVNGKFVGQAAHVRTHWLLPLLTNEPDELLRNFRRSGLDATRGVTSLVSLAGIHTPASNAMLSQIVYFPLR